MNATTKYSEQIRRFAPIGYEGLWFHPLRVSQFALYQIARPAMELMLSTLPLRYVRMSWFQALEALDREAAERGAQTGYFASFLRLLDAALQTDAIHNPQAILCARDAEGVCKALIVRQNDQATALTEKHMSQVREILAAQNGYTIPDENWNPELVRAQAYLREQQSGPGVSGSLEDAVFALAAATGQRVSEIWDWPIREFQQMQSAVDRRLRFQICTAAELSGQVKFTHGNPYPSWIWERKSELPRGFTSLKELDDGAHGLLGTSNE